MFWATLSFIVRSYFKGKKIPAYFIDCILIWLHVVSQGYGIRIKTKLKQKKNFHQVVPGQLGLCGLTLSLKKGEVIGFIISGRTYKIQQWLPVVKYWRSMADMNLLGRAGDVACVNPWI